MKIAELKDCLANYPEEQLRLVITEIYKAIPKAVKEAKEIDSIIKNPGRGGETRNRGARQEQLPDIGLLKNETETFIECAKNQYYLVPNQIVSKKERPKWRFTVKRLYKELLLAAQNERDIALASKLLEKLYELLCHACGYTVFNSYDCFESAGIEQKDFFDRVLFLKYQVESQRAFIKNAQMLMIDNFLNRYTLHSDLIEVILSFLKTSDLLEMAIEENKALLLLEKERSVPTSRDSFRDYHKSERINNLTEFGVFCYGKLHEIENAIAHYQQNYIERNQEVRLYLLLRYLFSLKQVELFLREYESAVKNGVKPRSELVKMANFAKSSGRLPDHFGWIGPGGGS